jgi:uncharacterized protein (DUF427 family)
MGLMTGRGPLGKEPAGTFNFDGPPVGGALYLEPTAKRIRAELGEVVVADSTGAFLLHESGHQPVYYFPPQDVRTDLFEPSPRRSSVPTKGDATYFTLRAGDEVLHNGAWTYENPPPAAPPQLKGLIAFYFNRLTRWREESQPIHTHPRDPYTRVDVLATDRHVRVSLGGARLAETDRALAVFETSLPVRWYLPIEDVSATLTPTDTVTACPYKGFASYYSVEVPDGEDGRDLVWYYVDPYDEVRRVKDLVCFFNEKVDIEVDGVLQPRPESAWDGRVGSPHLRGAQNEDPVVTRG